MPRPLVENFTAEGMSIDFGSYQSMAHSDWGEHLTGCIDLATKVIYLCPVKPESAASDHYNTQVRGRRYARVAGNMYEEITHSDAKTGHEQIATYVLKSKYPAENVASGLERFGGFALRMEAKTEGVLKATRPGHVDDNKSISLSGSSGTLNDGKVRLNRQLEACVLSKIHQYLGPVINKVHKVDEFVIAGPRVQPRHAGNPLMMGVLAGIKGR